MHLGQFQLSKNIKVIAENDLTVIVILLREKEPKVLDSSIFWDHCNHGNAL